MKNSYKKFLLIGALSLLYNQAIAGPSDAANSRLLRDRIDNNNSKSRGAFPTTDWGNIEQTIKEANKQKNKNFNDTMEKISKLLNPPVDIKTEKNKKMKK